MKKIYCLLAAAILAVGCTEDITTDNIVVNDEANQEMIEVVANLEIPEDSRTTLIDEGQGGKVMWSEGDTIGAIDKDGNVTECAVTSIDGPSAKFSVPESTVYAIYPYTTDTVNDSAKGRIGHRFAKDFTLDGSTKVFGDKQNVMVAQYSSGELAFKHVCGYIEVKLKGTGTVKHIALRGNTRTWDALSGLAYISLKDIPEPTAAFSTGHKAAFNWLYATCNNVELSKEKATSFYFIVPPRTYDNLSICVQTDKGSYAISANKAVTVNRAKIRPIAAIDIDDLKPATATDLSAKGLANCYVVPEGAEAKYYSFPARKINGTANLVGAYAHVVWSESATLVTNVSYDAATGTVSFKYEGNNAEGNALVSVFNNNNAVIWSWHIWCTDQPQMLRIKANSVNTIYGQLDRNLGATYAPKTVAQATGISADDATDAAGLYYQYGRPTPFPRVADITKTATESPAFKGNTRVAVEYGFRSYAQDFRRSVTTGFDYDTATQYPNMFYQISYTDTTGATLGGNNTYNTWYSGTAEKPIIDPNTQKAQMWYSLNNNVVDKKADNDPCPAGYVVEEGYGVYNNRYTLTTVGKYGLYYVCSKGTLVWFPASGYRNHGSGSAASIGSNFNIWAVPTRAVTDGPLAAVRWNANIGGAAQAQAFTLNYYQLAQGFAVRCRVMDRSGLQN